MNIPFHLKVKTVNLILLEFLNVFNCEYSKKFTNVQEQSAKLEKNWDFLIASNKFDLNQQFFDGLIRLIIEDMFKHTSPENEVDTDSSLFDMFSKLNNDSISLKHRKRNMRLWKQLRQRWLKVFESFKTNQLQ